MAENNGIRGISISIGAETTGLQDALKDVNKAVGVTARELREVESGLRFNPQSTELLAQRQELLARQIENTTTRLNTLRQAQEQVNAQFERGEISPEQFRSFNREVERTAGILDGLNNRRIEIEADSQGVGRLNSAIEQIGPGAENAGNLASSAFRGVATAATVAGAAVGTALGAIGASQEAARDVAILNTQLSQVDLSLDDVSASTARFAAVGQETDQISEAFGNLVQAGYTTVEQIDDISQNIAGAIVAYGDTFSSEGLSESITSTTQLGEATGQFLDLLEKQGINVDSFNTRLQSTSDVGERANIISEALADEGLAKLYEAYATGNPELVAQAQASQQLEQNWAELISTLTPLLTGLTEFANILLEVANGNKTLEEAFEEISSTAKEVFPAIAKEGIERFKEIQEGVAELAPKLTEFIQEALTSMLDLIIEHGPDFLENGIEIVTNIVEGLSEALPSVGSKTIELVEVLLEKIIENFPQILKTGSEVVQNLIKGITNLLPQIITTALKLIVTLAEAIIKNLPQILKAGGEIILKLIEGISGAVGQLGASIVTEVIPKIISSFAGGDWAGIGKDIISGLLSGLTSTAKNVYSKAKEIASNIENTIRSALKTRSPSRVMIAIGQDIINGLIVGLQDESGNLNAQTQKIVDDFLYYFDKTGQIGTDGLKLLNASEIDKELAEAYNKVVQFNSSIKSFEDAALRGSENIAKQRLDVEKKYSDLTLKVEEEKNRALEILRQSGGYNDYSAAVTSDAIFIRYAEQFSKLDEEIKNLNENEKIYFDAVKDVSKSALEAQKDYVSKLKKYNKLTLADEKKLYEEFSSNYSEDSEEFRYFANEKIRVQKELSDSIVKINENYTAKIKSANDELSRNIEGLESKYNDSFNSIRDGILSATSGFGEFQRKDKVQGRTLIKNLESQIRAINEYNSVINSLGGRVDDEGFIQYLQSLGPDSLAELEALNSLSREELNRYVDLYNERFEKASNSASIQLEGLREDTDKQILALQQETASQLEVYQQEWANAIANITGNVQNQFSELPKTMEETGRDIISSISKGLSDTLPSLQAQLQSIANTISDSISSALDTQKFYADIQSSSQRLANATNSAFGSLSSSVGKSTAQQTSVQNIVNQQANDNKDLISAVNNLASRAIETYVTLDGRILAQAVSTHQYQNASINALTKGVQIY